MANRKTRDVHSDATPDAPLHPDAPTRDQVPARRRGGQELPDDVQDRPEQNAGYDAAVRGDTGAARGKTADELTVDPAFARDDRGVTLQEVPDTLDTEAAETPDDRAEREVIAEVRRRERRR